MTAEIPAAIRSWNKGQPGGADLSGGRKETEKQKDR